MVALAAGAALSRGTSASAATTDVPILMNQTSQTQDVWVFGDSIVAGTWLPHPARDSWVSRVNERIGGEHCQELANYGIGGKTLLNYPSANLVGLVSTAPPVVAAAASKPRLVIISIGTNDLMDTDSQEAMAQGFTMLRTSLLDAGAGEVMFTTILPYGIGSAQPDAWLPILDARRNAVNDWLRATWKSQGLLIERDGLLEAPFSPYMDDRYQVGDGLHPNQWGALILADAIKIKSLGITPSPS
jgi:lysophospholipase L1-like esterase